jgi:CBS domain containing-hemolysin-like protein
MRCQFAAILASAFHLFPAMTQDLRVSLRKSIAVFTLLCATSSALAASGAALDSMAAPGPATNTDVLLLALYVLLALLFSFLCSVAEAVLLSITPSYIAELKEKNPKHARRLQKIKEENIDRSLAAILTVNTIAHTVGAIGAGAKATVVFGSTWFGVFSAVMTLLILFVSEIIPKTLGAVYWRKLTRVTAAYVKVLTVLMYPLVLISELLTKAITRGNKVHVFSRDEFIAMASVGKQSGHINERESRIIRNLLRLEMVQAADVLTPRVVVSALPEVMTVNEALRIDTGIKFSRLPIYSDSIDTVTGFVLREDLLQAKAQGQGERTLVPFRREILVVAPTAELLDLLELFLQSRQHIALVVGKYGETDGILTLEDVMETLLGMEIVDEGDKVVDMQALARQLWKTRAKGLGVEVDSPATKDEIKAASDSDQPAR